MLISLKHISEIRGIIIFMYWTLTIVDSTKDVQAFCRKEDLHKDFIHLSPDEWATVWPSCAKTHQSPVNIVKDNTTTLNKNLTVDFSSYSKPIKRLTLENDGYAVEMKPHEELTITGGPLGQAVYICDKLHIHYGYQNRRMSEHKINNHHFDLEIHFVHHNRKYNFDEAAVQPGGLFVLSVLGKLGNNDNEAYSKILGKLREVPMKGNVTEVTKDIPKFSELLPTNIQSFFFYNGSLTTPPCCESVYWMVFEHPVHISEKQLKEFRWLKTNNRGIITEHLPNIRPVQNLNDRVVFYHH